MYIIRNDIRNAYKTYDGWTTIVRDGNNGTLNGLNDVIRFTEREAQLNVNKLPKGSRFVYFPRIQWKEIQNANRT